MSLLAGSAVAVALLFLLCASLLLLCSFRVTRHTIGASQRKRSAEFMRLCNTALLVFLSIFLILGIVYFGGHNEFGWAGRWSVRAVAILSLTGFILLAIVTVGIRDLPGRSTLRRLENVLAVLLSLLLAGVAIFGLRFADDALPTAVPASAGALALMFAFFIVARPYLRGSLVITEHIVRHGSRPNREATLKRLMRRFRPMVIASMAALIAGVVLLQ